MNIQFDPIAECEAGWVAANVSTGTITTRRAEVGGV